MKPCGAHCSISDDGSIVEVILHPCEMDDFGAHSLIGLISREVGFSESGFTKVALVFKIHKEPRLVEVSQWLFLFLLEDMLCLQSMGMDVEVKHSYYRD